MNKRLAIALAIVLATTAPLLLTGYKEGPVPNMTGGFGDATCRSCHLDNPLNDHGGVLAVIGIPVAYVGSKTYQISIRVARQGMLRGGFEIAARFAAGPQLGKQAGTWQVIDARTQIVNSTTGSSLQFVEHTAAGSSAPSGANTWTTEWVAPASLWPVQFNIAANAANDDASPLGDYVYVKELRSAPMRQ